MATPNIVPRPLDGRESKAMRERGNDEWVLYWMRQKSDRPDRRRGANGPERPSSGQEIAAFLHDLAIILVGFFGVIAVLRLVAAVLR
jgi:hypothetical protein